LTRKKTIYFNAYVCSEEKLELYARKGEPMKIRKTIMVLVLLPLFLSVGHADDNNASVK